jgi:hypothetical protein
MVKEQLASISLNEPKTSIRHQLFDLSLWHFSLQLKRRETQPTIFHRVIIAAGNKKTRADEAA